MASPFTVFRRNQKVLLATVGLLAIIAFVFLTPLMQYVGPSRKQENPVVVETNYGNLTRQELENLEYSRNVVDRFLRRVTSKVIANQVGQGTLDARLFETLAERHYLIWHQQLLGRSHEGPEQAAIETLVLSNRAKQMGMVISDRAINDLLKQITADSLTSAELEEIIRGLQPSRPISVGRLFESIRTEMLASQYSQLFVQSLRDVPPAQRFEYYSRLNRRATAEVMPLAVADFVGQVADPDQNEIKQFYNKYKNDYPNPDSPEPGFREPERATFEYFKADIAQLTDAIEPEITDQEIAEYYENNKEQFRAFDFEEEGAKTETPPEEGKEGEAAPDGEKPANEPESGEDKGTRSEESTPAEKPPEPKAENEKPLEGKPAEDEATEAKPPQPETKANDENEDDSAPQAGRSPARTVVRLASAALAGGEPQDDDKPADESANEENAPAEPAKAKAEQPDTPPAKPKSSPQDEKSTEEKPAEASQDEPAKTEAANPPEEKPAGEKPAEKPRFEPLEKVADTIRTSLARQRAEVRVRDQFEELTAAMRRYTDDSDIYTAEKGANPLAKPPAPLDFAELAKGKDVQAAELKSVTAAEAAKTDLGKSFRVVEDQRAFRSHTVPFTSFAFAETLPTYKYEVVQDNENHAFLFWKTQLVPAYVPPLQEIREKVVRAWKMIKARDLARQRAEEYAVQARELKSPLQTLFGTQAKLKITDTAPFSWLTLGNVPAQPGTPPRLSEVDGVDRVGPEFMQAVFDLPPAGIGVGMNEPQTIVYVIRLIEFEPAMAELRDDFARTNPSRYMAAAGDDQRRIYQAWVADLNKEAGVRWIRQADSRRETDPGQADF